MVAAFDHAEGRPEHIQQTLDSLDRYNPAATESFQAYVDDQASEPGLYDCYANLALLKLYQFNPHLSREETVTAILVKALTVFPSPDFSLCLHLLPPSVLLTNTRTGPDTSSLAVSVQALNVLNTQLSSADYASFWNTLRSDDLYADLVAEVTGFEDLVRQRIASMVSQTVREVEGAILEEWLELSGERFEEFVRSAGWQVESRVVKVPLNKENEAKGTVVRENVKFDQFARVVRRAYEQPV